VAVVLVEAEVEAAVVRDRFHKFEIMNIMEV
jgi:hypothetical protein